MQVGVPQPHLREILVTLLESALRAVQPQLTIQGQVRRRGWRLEVAGRPYDLRRYSRIVVVGAGKASGAMAAAIEQVVGKGLTPPLSGLVVVKYGHRVPTRWIRLVEGGHPVPDEAGQRATQQIRTLVSGLTARDLMIVLLSGGASSLLVAPAPRLSLADKQRTTQLLLRSGASIRELNTVRKHLSTVKGGQLLAATRARVVTLILSDVIGDDLGTIGSGPTAPDPTRYGDACTVLEHYALWHRVPARIRARLIAGRRGRLAETPKPGRAVFRRVQNVVLGNNRAALEAVATTAKRLGLRPMILSSTLTGEARDAAKLFGAVAREIAATGRPLQRPVCVIAGGELTVTVRGSGTGGRAQEFALAAAQEIAGLRNTWVVGFGTDGTDGPTPAAGAAVDGQTVSRAGRLGVDLQEALRQNDVYPVLKRLRALIMSGPTGTNVNDLYLLLAI
jgi:glycerate 2-kinase